MSVKRQAAKDSGDTIQGKDSRKKCCLLIKRPYFWRCYVTERKKWGVWYKIYNIVIFYLILEIN